MDIPTPYDEFEAARTALWRDALLREVADYAASHGLVDASLMNQIGAYLRDAETQLGKLRDAGVLSEEELVANEAEIFSRM